MTESYNLPQREVEAQKRQTHEIGGMVKAVEELEEDLLNLGNVYDCEQESESRDEEPLVHDEDQSNRQQGTKQKNLKQQRQSRPKRKKDTVGQSPDPLELEKNEMEEARRRDRRVEQRNPIQPTASPWNNCGNHQNERGREVFALFVL
ncbi:unnamed protein product [Haemonchus placei]|uniref:Shootin-1 n=1 Tax=Haemonchus placei TaxID=6290 RepID=A0A0N4WKU6_HAEPC|nr:unnamed protein product [Haemonchus placei]